MGSDAPLINREQEAALYAFLRDTVEEDALRYQLIAQKIGRAADGVAEDHEIVVVRALLESLESASSMRLHGGSAKRAIEQMQAQVVAFRSALRAGDGGDNPRLQAWMDTLEDPDTLFAPPGSSPLACGYSAFIADRCKEFDRAGGEGGDELTAYMRQWADARLAARVTARRGATLSRPKG